MHTEIPQHGHIAKRGVDPEAYSTSFSSQLNQLLALSHGSGAAVLEQMLPVVPTSPSGCLWLLSRSVYSPKLGLGFALPSHTALD